MAEDLPRDSFDMVKSLSTIRRAKGRLKHKNASRLQLPGPIQSSAKLKRERMMTYPIFRLDPAIPSLSHCLAAQNAVNPSCQPSILEHLVLKGELLLSSLLRPDPGADNLGFQDPLVYFEEENGGKSKGRLINFGFAITSAFNVPITGLMFPPLERRVRVCLFDGCNFVGNVHVFPAVSAFEDEDEPWDFVNKGASRCLVQYSSKETLKLFVEVNVCYNSTDENQAREITCAWSIMNLPYNASEEEELLSKSSSELPLLVGNMDRPVNVNTVHISSGRSRVVVKKGGDSSAIHLHWYKLSEFQKKYSRLLPETILASNEDFPFLVLYRQALMDTLLSEKSMLLSPLVQLYPWMLNERGKEVQELFKAMWGARKLEWPPNTDCVKKKNRERYLKGFNYSLLMVWPLLRSYKVGPPSPFDFQG